MPELLLKALLLAAIQLVIAAALVWTGAHTGSVRFWVVLKISFFASLLYLFRGSSYLTGSNFWFEGEWVDTPTPSVIWKLLAVMLGIIALVCFFAIGNET